MCWSLSSWNDSSMARLDLDARQATSQPSHGPGPPLSTYVRRLTHLILIGLLISFTGPGCGSRSGSTAESTHTAGETALRRGIGGEPASLDPGEATDIFSFEVIRDLYEGLASEGPDGSVIPGVASSWAVDASGTQYTFQLRPDAKWSN